MAFIGVAHGSVAPQFLYIDLTLVKYWDMAACNVQFRWFKRPLQWHLVVALEILVHWSNPGMPDGQVHVASHSVDYPALDLFLFTDVSLDGLKVHLLD